MVFENHVKIKPMSMFGFGKYQRKKKNVKKIIFSCFVLLWKMRKKVKIIKKFVYFYII